MDLYWIRPVREADRPWMHKVIVENRGSPEVITRGRVHLPENYPGFLAQGADEPLGLVTYRVEKNACEIVTLNVLRPGIGIGTALVKNVLQQAQEQGCDRVWLVTTNDNFIALRFYQRQGFRLAALHRDAVTKVREKLRPGFPLFGLDSIPIHDEIELEVRWRSPGGN